MEQVGSRLRAPHFSGHQNPQIHQTSRTANFTNCQPNNCQPNNCQPNNNQLLSDKDLHVMILHFLYNEANCPHAAREFIQNSSKLSHIQQQLETGTGEISLYSPHLHTAKMTVSQILSRFFEEHPELSPNQSYGIMRISPTKLGLSESDRFNFSGTQSYSQGLNSNNASFDKSADVNATNSHQVIGNSNQVPTQVTSIQKSHVVNNLENTSQQQTVSQNYIPITSAQNSFFKSPTSSSKRKKQVPRKVQLNSVKNIVDFKEAGKRHRRDLGMIAKEGLEK